jgi:hypothetical protein
MNQKIRRMDSSEHSFDRFTNEATETREQIFNSVKVLCGIKSMCKYGRIIDDIFTGSNYVIKVVSDLRQVGGLFRVLRFYPPIKLTATI